MAKVELKQPIVDEISAAIKDAQSLVVVDYRGLTVEQDTVLRKELREAGVTYEVVKNTLLKIAIKDTDLEGMSDKLEGTTALAIAGSEDPLAAARILHKFAEASKGKFEIKTGYMDGEVLDITGIQKLATLPNREGLLSMLLSALTGNLSGLARALDAVKTKMEGEGEVA